MSLDGSTSDIEQQAQAQAQEEQHETDNNNENNRIYLVTDGIKSPQTKQIYRNAFNYFIAITFKTQNQSKLNLYQNQQYLRTLLDFKPSVIESRIIDFVEYQKASGLAYSTIHVRCAAVFHFFEFNNVNLNTRKIKRCFPEDESENVVNDDRPYSVTEIQQILAKCDVRSRAVVLIMASTGMRIGGLRGLRYEDIKKINEYGLYLIWVYARSRKDRYYTFCTPECAEAIDAYLDFRRTLEEEIKDKSPLIRDQFNIDNPFTAQSPKFLTARSISHILEYLLKRSGVNQIKVGKIRRSVMTSHGFRKFYITECVRSNIINHSTWKYLVGHKLPSPDSSYILLTEEDRLKEYVRVIPLLTISEREKQRLQSRIRELETTEAELSRNYKYLRRKSEEYEARMYEVMAEMEEFKEWRNSFSKAATDLRNYTRDRDSSPEGYLP